MKKLFKTLISTLLVSSMMISAVGCSKAYEKAGDEFMNSLLSCEFDDCFDMSDKEDVVEDFLNTSYFTDDSDILEAIFNDSKFKLTEKEEKKNKTELTYTVTIVDYEEALEDYEFGDDIVDLIEDCEETTEIEITLFLKEDDGEWIVTNYGDALITLSDISSYCLTVEHNALVSSVIAEIDGAV